MIGSSVPQGQWTPEANDTIDSHHARSLVEMGSGLALWSVLYWITMDRNVADWDNPEPLERFTGAAWRLDNNSLGVNWIAHPLMGGAAYNFARANHHDPATSFGYSFLTSFLWEFVLEFKEKVSVNDFIATPGTGVPIGEFFYKLGLYLDTSDTPSLSSEIARWTLGTAVATDRALDGRPAPVVRDRDSLGYSRKVWHRFEARAGTDFVQSAHSAEFARASIGIRGQLVTLPEYLEATNRHRFFYRAELSDFAMTTEASRHGVGMTLSADTIVAGYHSQALSNSTGQPRGLAATAGISVAYRYLKSKANNYSEFRDAEALPDPNFAHHVPTVAEQFSAFHLPGPALDWHVLARDLHLSASVRAHPDFASLGAPAFYDWAATHPEQKGKHILHRQGYFYAWGGSGELIGRLRLGPLRASGQLFYGRYRSQDGLDRHLERIDVDVPARGSVLTYEASFGVKPAMIPLSLAVDFGVRHWFSQVEGYQRRGRSVSRGFSATLEF